MMPCKLLSEDAVKQIVREFKLDSRGWIHLQELERREIIRRVYRYYKSDTGICLACGSQSLAHQDSRKRIAQDCPVIRNHGYPLDPDTVCLIFTGRIRRKKPSRKTSPYFPPSALEKQKEETVKQLYQRTQRAQQRKVDFDATLQTPFAKQEDASFAPSEPQSTIEEENNPSNVPVRSSNPQFRFGVEGNSSPYSNSAYQQVAFGTRQNSTHPFYNLYAPESAAYVY